MKINSNTSGSEKSSRRQFLKTGATAAVAGSLMTSLNAGAFAAGDEILRVGLVGCGGRGTGAAAQALNADPQNRLVAMADAFDDRLQRSLKTLQTQFDEKVTVDKEFQLSGFDAYKKVIDTSDVVILTTPPHFRPAHLKYAITQGKHVFCEKPVAVDAPGIRSVLETTELAKKKNLSLVSGLCWRYHPTIRATFDQMHSGAIGEITAMQCSYHSNGVWEPRKTREECKSEMEYQMRNWYYYTWLCGDFNVEQHVHSLDKMAWAMRDETPVKVSGSGGRQQRTDPKYGNIYDHFSVVYEYANGVKAFARCRHFRGCTGDVTDHIFGTKGTCHIAGSRTSIEGDNNWRYKGESGNMYQIEHNEMFAAIRAGKPINNGHYMSMSSMLAIAGRMSAYTGKTLTWDQCFNSKEDLTPKAYEWGDIPVPEVAIPGITQFV
ncbi:MAG: Gfo/Idh/MocA family oxidoreductase [Planctomycetes bacterium]|nr:Gfo/Idh/MocA family oxidoreductase [Planctomycetota bacterium]